MFDDILKKPNPVVMLLVCPFCRGFMFKINNDFWECKNCEATLDDGECEE